MSKLIDAELLKSTRGLYFDIDTCITELLQARVKKNKDVEGKALFRIEGLMVATLQQLSCIIDFLQQEQPKGGCSEKPNDLLLEQEPTCKTCDYYENDCPFTRGKLMVYPNKVCNDYTHSAMKQEQVGVRCEHSLPSNLDEAAEKYAEDTWLTGENWGDAARRTFKAGAEWMAGKFQKIEGCLVDWYSTSDGKEYCCGIKADEAFEIPEGFYIRKKQQPGESLKENEDGNK